jgi:hypothetical protein
VPTKKRRIGPRQIRHAAAMPAGCAWWLRNGRSPSIAEARELGLTERDVWLISNLHYARPIASGWTRADLRELGYGPQIDDHVAHGRCPADGWRTPPSAEVIELPRKSAEPAESLG